MTLNNNTAYHVEELVIEVGRQCNMRCPHCLRGEPQNLAIDTSYIQKLLSSVSSISTLVLTGGEPFLYPSKIRFIVNEIIKRKISIDNFFIATNGTVKSFDVIDSLLKLYNICNETDLCGLKISTDSYHDAYKDIWKALYGLSFTYEGKDIPEEYLLSEGRADGVYDTQREPSDTLTELNDSNIAGMIYLAANGNILIGCDYSYINQEEHAIGNIRNSSFQDIIQKLSVLPA